METWHVLPTDDSRRHSQHLHCKCEPRVEVQPNGDKVVIHNAWDGREFFESEPDEVWRLHLMKNRH